ncbi:glucose-6-phosphate dehydrogenase [Paraburkholderia caballeronis]|uniref:Glucose-6-phosphate 1-dehydrogenase n=1 Tax=Paraburkholderia caballeronis TaxID=416943 RepID=A0A1H7LRV4_9BURK|nr:glucose-6-phosphate dehydrogenase [Paraburkholderia caballeronis]PXW28574.1 glucose-6-phosphate 1-dehydrogenase [Paraburkholderia caballeronis]PXX03940.1 glucose-6-phosphate 1-dehydrogenase [Paraburkholderia caballeronis]RAK04684.1 glucose-6-phosphate 1-dehydrogenase [Paraburkholderia caballeronis]SED69719.1 glucose-6-phosphate 1-dehydrogenase [Paraburkholderia caballeronis]SEL01650.1 glucose-6-phosphate 1-dehydrogenase [Paraburkholderia caballeronis]
MSTNHPTSDSPRAPTSPKAAARPHGAPASPAGRHPAPPCTLVIFGAGGDLTKRLLMPALYNLAVDGLLDDGMKVIGVNHGERETKAWCEDLHSALQQFAADKASTFHTDKLDDNAWNWIARRLHYIAGDFEDDDAYQHLAQQLDGNAQCNVVFYLAVSARFFKPIVERLGKAGLLKQDDDGNGPFRRIVIEKPFGTDLASARDLNRHLLTFVRERQIYRIDHFLGKDTVQSILAVRFANALFEPIWRREYIDSVQITASEMIGVEGRGSFYEQTGAFRDMVPNHLFQLLGMVAMEPPNSFDAEAVRDRKAEIFDALKPLTPDDVVFGQYGKGLSGAAYRHEPDVAPDSQRETYAAARVQIDNWRWAGVPFYLRTGKRLAARRTEISVHLKNVPFRPFRATAVDTLTPNVMTLRIDPSHGTSFHFNVKTPGPVMQIDAVHSSFDYDDFFAERANVGYETLLYDCMLGDETLFQRADSIEATWAAVDGVLHPKHGVAIPVYDYAAGGAGPAEADALLACDGRAWRSLTPTEPT